MKKILICLCLVCLLAGCSAKRSVFRAPDESQVSQNKPLILPPDYDVRPPQEKK